MKSIIAIIILVCFAGCKKDSVMKRDKELPVIKLFSPVDGNMYTPGQIIKIGGYIRDNNFIAEVHIVMTNNNTGAEFLHAHMYAQGDSTVFDHDIAAISGINYKVAITAVDRNLNQAYSQVIFSCP